MRRRIGLVHLQARLIVGWMLSMIALQPLLAAPMGDQKPAIVVLSEYLQKKPIERTDISFYRNCQELRNDLQASFDEMWIQDKAWISEFVDNDLRPPIYSKEGAATTAKSPSMAAGVNGATNVQEAGVDESDRFKVGAEQIYALSSDEYIQVLDRSSQVFIGSLHLPKMARTQLLTFKDNLIVLGIQDLGNGQEQTTLRIYQSKPMNLPDLIDERTYAGAMLSNRLIGSQLLLTLQNRVPEMRVPVPIWEFRHEPWFNNASKVRKLYEMRDQLQRPMLAKLGKGELAGLPCSSYVKRQLRDWDMGVVQVLSIDVAKRANVQQKSQALGMIGASSEMYVSTKHLYLLRDQVQWFSSPWWGKRPQPMAADEAKLRIQKLSFDSGFLQAEAYGQVRGRIKDRWSIKESADGTYLIVATTTGYLGAWNGGEVAQNHLFVLAENASHGLVKAASVENFAPKEDIRSVRFLGDFVYIVTFEKTDPLFAFDLTDPTQPRLMSELKIPGFSTYMHPLSETLLLGVGFDAKDMGDYSLFQGVKISLFGIENPSSISERQAPLIYGQRGSSSEVTSDPKAFFYDPEASVLGIPLVALHAAEDGSTARDFSGALLLTLQNEQISELARLTHYEWVPESCRPQLDAWRWWEDARASLDINRIYSFSDRLMTLSRWGLKVYAYGNFQTPMTEVQFSPKEASCTQDSVPIK